MEQPPLIRTVTVFPETVQTDGVFEAKLTGSSELAVALTLKGGVFGLTSVSAGNVIVCAAPPLVVIDIR